MKNIFSVLLLTVIAAASSSVFAGGSVDLESEEFRRVRLNPMVVVFEDTFSYENCAATRLGRHWQHLGGARVGPYTCILRAKQTGAPYELLIDTDITFYDDEGNEPEDEINEATNFLENVRKVTLTSLPKKFR